MTNREWLESLTKEELVSWLLDEETYSEPSPKLNSLKYGTTNTRAYLLKWLDEERKEQ